MDIKDVKKLAYEAGASQLAVAALVLERFDLHIKCRMILGWNQPKIFSASNKFH